MKYAKKLLLVVFVFGCGALFWVSFAPSALAITVGPAKMEYSVDPGEVLSGEVFLMNETKNRKTLYPTFEKYTEVDGKKKFIIGESEMADWFNFNLSSGVVLGPEEQAKVPFTLKVPQDAEPGGHFAVMWWSTVPPKKQSQQVSIVTRAGILVYLRVSGDIEESGRLVEFSTQNDKSFFNSRPVNFKVVFESMGNVHLKPRGKITIQNIFGRAKADLVVNEHSLQVLPKSKKTFEAKWSSDEGVAFGLYRAVIKLEYGETNKQIEKKITFFIIPWKKTLLGLLILAILVFGISKGLKKYNHWIIAKSQTQK